MKKFMKIIVIIAVVALLAFVGYIIYKKFTDKVEIMDSDKGWAKYSEVAGVAANQKIFTIEYSEEASTINNIETTKGTITTDDMGYYHLWSGTNEGSEYVIKGSGQYIVYSESSGTKKTSKISNANFASGYTAINDFGSLSFLTIKTMEDQEEYIMSNFYNRATNIKSGDGLVHTFGFMDDDTYFWKTTYKCTYEENGLVFTSTFKREIVFDTLVREVSIEKVDKELNSSGKVNKKGEKKTFDLSAKISYKTKQNIVQTDFSEYPAV